MWNSKCERLSKFLIWFYSIVFLFIPHSYFFSSWRAYKNLYWYFLKFYYSNFYSGIYSFEIKSLAVVSCILVLWFKPSVKIYQKKLRAFSIFSFGTTKTIPEYIPTVKTKYLLNKEFCYIWPAFGIQDCGSNKTLRRTLFSRSL